MSPQPRGVAASSAVLAEEKQLLDEERAFLLSSLRDLEREHDAGDIDDSDYRALKDGYTIRAAEVIRALETLNAPRASSNGSGGRRIKAAPAGGKLVIVEPPKRRKGTLLAVAGTLVLAATAGWLVTRTSSERLPGQASSGGPPTSADPAAQAVSAAQAVVFGQSSDALDALKKIDAALAVQPDNATVIGWQGMVIYTTAAQVGDPALVQKALDKVNRSIELDPKFGFAHFFKGIILNQGQHKAAEAVPEFRAFLASNPPPGMVSTVEQLLQEALTDAGGSVPTTTITTTTP